MEHHMNLHPAPFAMIRSGEKTIELRLYDEKRQRIRVGDTITFTCTGPSRETLYAAVTALHRFESFRALYQALPLTRCGYTAQTAPSARPEDMEAYYSPEQQRLYGVVGIELSLL